MEQIYSLLISYVLYMLQDSELGKYPICNILVDEEGKISAHIPTDYEEMFSEYDPVSTSSYDNIHTMDNS